MKPVIVKKTWKKEEDERLLKLVNEWKNVDEKIKGENWSAIAAKLGGRSGKQCRERYHNHLKNDIIKGQWTPEEDDIIKSLQLQHGNQWALISKALPGRSDNSVKNRWHILNRKAPTRGKSSKSDKINECSTIPREHKRRNVSVVPKLCLSHLHTASQESDTLVYNHNHADCFHESYRSNDNLSPMDTWRILEQALSSDTNLSNCNMSSTLSSSPESLVSEEGSFFSRREQSRPPLTGSHSDQTTVESGVIKSRYGTRNATLRNSQFELRQQQQQEQLNLQLQQRLEDVVRDTERSFSFESENDLTFEFSDEDELDTSTDDDNFFMLLNDDVDEKREQEEGNGPPLQTTHNLSFHSPAFSLTSLDQIMLAISPQTPRSRTSSDDTAYSNSSVTNDRFKKMIRMLQLPQNASCSPRDLTKNISCKRLRTHSLEVSPR